MPIGSSGYSARTLAVTHGTHSIYHMKPTVTFNALMYGQVKFESYGFPAGMALIMHYGLRSIKIITSASLILSRGIFSLSLITLLLQSSASRCGTQKVDLTKSLWVGFWGWGLELGFRVGNFIWWGFGPLVFFGVGALYINIGEYNHEKKFAFPNGWHGIRTPYIRSIIQLADHQANQITTFGLTAIVVHII